MNKKQITNTIGVILFLYWVLLLILTSTPAPDLPKVELSDKVIHFGAYFVLAVLFNLFVLFKRGRFLFEGKISDSRFTIVVLTMYAVFDEIHQSFIPGRIADVGDFIADTLGVLTAVIMINLSLRSVVIKKLILGEK